MRFNDSAVKYKPLESQSEPALLLDPGKTRPFFLVNRPAMPRYFHNRQQYFIMHSYKLHKKPDRWKHIHIETVLRQVLNIISDVRKFIETTVQQRHM